jgi:RNA polymerase sigma-70 factor (ECF subfamily)
MEELFAALESPLLTYALRLLRERSAAEDIVQEAFMKLHAQRDDVREPRPWLYRTVHNLALNAKRDTAKIVPFASPGELGSPAGGDSGLPSEASADATDPTLLPDEQIIRGERIGLVRVTLQTLDPRSRQVVQLKFDEDLSYQQISERTGLKIGHVGYLLHHALKTMAAELAHAGLLS